MSKHSEAVKAYYTLAEYMKNCHPRQENCQKCIFYMHYYTCLIERLGIHPDLALRNQDVKELETHLKWIENREGE